MHLPSPNHLKMVSVLDIHASPMNKKVWLLTLPTRPPPPAGEQHLYKRWISSPEFWPDEDGKADAIWLSKFGVSFTEYANDVKHGKADAIYG
ncbi:hypothetical protein Lal_00024571 [Lupinus albus]|nr:hypothetical protein Lal_00024571 [Lupinus albus]